MLDLVLRITNIKKNPIDIMEYANKTLINIIQIENESGLENVEKLQKLTI